MNRMIFGCQNGVKGWLGDFQWGLVETNTSFVNSKKSATNMFCSLIFGKLLPLNIFGIGLFFPNVKFLRVKIKNNMCSMKKCNKNLNVLYTATVFFIVGLVFLHGIDG